MRLIVARCQVSYVGRTTTVLPEAVRLLMCKGDGTFMVWADGGSPNVKPLNWMTPPTVWEEERSDEGTLERLVVRKQREDERLEIELAEVLTDVEHELDVLAPLEKEGLEREMQELLAAAPHWCGEGFRLVRREWPTDVGPVDLMCRDTEDEWVAVEIKRVATMDSVRQLEGYLERIRLDPAMSACRGVLVAKWIKPQARVMAESRGIACVEVDVEVLRGNREPELRLFAA
ncbi:MAG TPA: endonuclease NucS [Solirubrobacteraceae bacterium]|nr:endonuclease NucS [Solirubrobacteraceae bacterium]